MNYVSLLEAVINPLLLSNTVIIIKHIKFLYITIFCIGLWWKLINIYLIVKIIYIFYSLYNAVN